MSIPRRSFALPLHWTLRIACVWCFVGHGVFGLRLKPAWVPYVNLFGFGDDVALRILPIVGTVDILVGLATLIRPCRAVLLWMTFWGLFTALLRPAAGEPWWEVLERAGNYGVPFAFLILSGRALSRREWWEPISPARAAQADNARIERVATILRVTTGMLLIGHGGFGAFMHKPMLEQHYLSAGLSAWPIEIGALVAGIGWFEIVLGIAALARPFPLLLMFIVLWKLATEMLYPFSGAPIWEFVERGGSYGAPLALYWIRARASADDGHPSRRDLGNGRIPAPMRDAHQVDAGTQT